MTLSPTNISGRQCFPLAAVVGCLAAAVVLLLPPTTATAQRTMPGPPPTEVVDSIRVDQKLDGQVPLDLVFRDEAGNPVELRKYFGGTKPVILALVYYECPMLCSMTLNGLTRSFKPLGMTVGKDFDVLTVSFDPRETHELAAAKKQSYMKDYGRPGADIGWHFLTGDAEPIRQLTESVGFHYYYDERTEQYAHASAIMLLTPQGRISRYFYGLEYSSRDLSLGLVEASENRIGTLAEKVMLLCYEYDPTTGKYGVAIMRTLRAAGVVTMVALGTFMFVMIRRERRVKVASGVPASPSPGTPGEGKGEGLSHL